MCDEGPRETVAKALTLECMRAAREQDRGCYVFAFSGPREVRCPDLKQGDPCDLIGLGEGIGAQPRHEERQ